ncbi:MAG: hypothetical protein CSB33_05245 [Desulfobacterales bacterium]|nr:MAG: hypothetical protein CSB33_05245 [Desulfobacterales bacterium]
MRRICPKCQTPLKAVSHKSVDVDHCRLCRGTFLDPGEDRDVLGVFASPELWKDAGITEELGPGNHLCPDHRETMTAYRVAFGDAEVEVDLCPVCLGMWLDQGEGMKLRRIVMHAGQDKKTEMADKAGIQSYLFQLVSGFPGEVWNPCVRPPVVTRSLIVLLYLIYLLQILTAGLDGGEGYPAMLRIFAMWPAAIMAGQDLWTLLTNAFLHGGWMHIIGNSYFLYIFGDNVEDVLGHRRYLALYLLSALCGSAAQALWTGADGSLPVLGASGAVAGLMGAYLILFSRAKLYMVILFIRFRVTAWFYLGGWLVFNLLMAVWGADFSVAWMDHAGGFVTGAMMAWWWRPKELDKRFGEQQ